MKLPILIDHRAAPVIKDENVCECKKEPVLMTYKKAVIYWQKTVGALVSQGELVAEGEIEKQSIAVTAPADGILCEICVAEGQKAGVNTPLGYIESED
ncbi:lipoyl domain-containing protein [Eubacterium sp. 1001713B170207_170306_E7]|uniref:lipoyl domain-containing protein n=1 Tax=Eubacterium sp. 1001713B170207_170306_E7 TaxID=2787097 RepID=UPI0018994D37|nr:lipoyl domain-containing protein [Eubacterium sp. 1001713B170207_170306_E7]